MNHLTIMAGDCRTSLASLPENSVPCCVTSPPYWQKRDYGHADQLGMEATPEDFVENLLVVMDGVRRVLTPTGSLWLNLGDSYAAGGNGGGGSLREKRAQWREIIGRKGWRKAPPGYKSKDLTLVPFLTAFALREAGWYLRQTIVWWRRTANEPNRLDRPAVSHEYLFLLTKSEDSAVRDPGEAWWSQSVWEIPITPSGTGHPAPMPVELARRCIVSGSQHGDTILDPFGGSGTTGRVALELGRRALLMELNPDYVPIIRRRCEVTMGLHL